MASRWDIINHFGRNKPAARLLPVFIKIVKLVPATVQGLQHAELRRVA